MRKSCGGVGVWNNLNFTTRPRENLVVGLGCGIFKFHHKTTRFTTRFLNAIGNVDFLCFLLMNIPTRPRENLVVGLGYGIFWISPQDHKKILWWGWGMEYFEFHHKTMRKSCGGVGVWNIWISPQDHKIHHKISEYYRKCRFYMFFINEYHHKTTRKSCSGVGVWNILNFTTRPRENLVVGVVFGIFSVLPRDHKIHHKIFRSK